MSELQLELLSIVSTDSKRLSHRSDPDTSRAAAQRVVKTGIASRQRRSVLAAVERWPGRTTAELAVLMQCDRSVPARRMSELERAGLVERTDKRRCTVKSSMAGIYKVTDRGARELRT